MNKFKVLKNFKKNIQLSWQATRNFNDVKYHIAATSIPYSNSKDQSTPATVTCKNENITPCAASEAVINTKCDNITLCVLNRLTAGTQYNITINWSGSGLEKTLHTFTNWTGKYLNYNIYFYGMIRTLVYDE